MDTGEWISVLVGSVVLGLFLAPKLRAGEAKLEAAVSGEKAAIKAQLEALQWRVSTDVRMTLAEVREELASIGKRL